MKRKTISKMLTITAVAVLSFFVVSGCGNKSTREFDTSSLTS